MGYLLVKWDILYYLYSVIKKINHEKATIIKTHRNENYHGNVLQKRKTGL